MFGDLPPSSSVTRFSVSAAPRMISLPTAVDPVNAILSMPGMSHHRLAGLRTAGHDVQHARRQARFDRQFAQAQAVSGVCSAGFNTMVLPQASAGPSFHEASSSGKFQGTISPTTPTGSRSV